MRIVRVNGYFDRPKLIGLTVLCILMAAIGMTSEFTMSDWALGAGAVIIGFAVESACLGIAMRRNDDAGSRTDDNDGTDTIVNPPATRLPSTVNKR